MWLLSAIGCLGIVSSWHQAEAVTVEEEGMAAGDRWKFAPSSVASPLPCPERLPHSSCPELSVASVL